MRIHESGENYLETILLLKNKSGFVRAVDIANAMDFTKPSVSRAMSILKEEGYITIEKYGNIEFTEKGLRKANDVYERHNIITGFLVMTLGVDEETASIDACKMEHIVGHDIFENMKKFVKANGAHND
ncbi:MAG: metal-dependent transcriptional regulator [Clostridiales bacterium]|jgi:Mn-dependent DtxR family transcriptional regulator|nr:metal-dependent transcriptional regulator [Clostridiales bacterium]